MNHVCGKGEECIVDFIVQIVKKFTVTPVRRNM